MISASSKQVPRIGVGILVIKDNKVLLGRRSGKHGDGCYGPPGGNLEFGETIEACAIRELAEETGLKALSVQVGPWTEDIFDDQKHYISFFCITTEFEGIPEVLEPAKCHDWGWYDWDELPSPLFLPMESFLKENVGNFRVFH